MTDIPIITGNFPDGSPFVFSLNGAATQKQMERLIELTAVLAKQRRDVKKDPAMAAYVDSLKENTAELDKNTKTSKKNVEESVNFHDALQNLSTVTHLARGHLTAAFNGINRTSTALAAGMGGMVGSLFSYSQDLGKAMQRGVGGEVLDFAIASKTAGLTMDQMNKALEETGGSFAMLGSGATDGAKQFAGLVNEVRTTTASVGNLGLSNDQLAVLTAQQVKVAVSQGFKGKAAQNMVIESSKDLAEELEDLSSRTGKSVLELAAASQKLAMNPLVSNFVATAREGGVQISKAVNAFAANMQGVFGKAGEQISTDALENAMAGLPLSMSETGKNMLIASSSVYSEIERQGRMSAAGQKITEQDTQRLRGMVLQEVDARRQELLMLSKLPGAAGEGAKQLLSMAQEARSYNTEESKKRRAQDETSRKFMAATNELRANLQQLMIPLLNLANGINWTLLMQVLQGFTAAMQVVLFPLTLLGKVLGDTGLGSVIGGFLGVATAVSMVAAGFGLLKRTITDLAATIMKASARIGMSGRGGIPGGIPDIPDKGTPGKGGGTAGKGGILASIASFFATNAATIGKGIGISMAGAAVGMVGDSKLAEDADSTWGKILSIGGKVMEWGGLIVTLIPVVKLIKDNMSSLMFVVGMLQSFIKNRLMDAFVAFRAMLSATALQGRMGKVGDALGNLGGAAGKLGKWGKIGGGALTAGLAAWELSDIESQRQAGIISDKEANKSSAGAVGAAGGGYAGAAIGAGFGSAFGGVGAIPGAIIGGILGSLGGYFGGSGMVDLFSGDGAEGASTALNGAQSNAVDRTSMKETENTKQLAQLNKNMETLISSSDANLMLAGRNVSINDTNSRYLRGANFGSA